jgi:hypothetical protein
MVVFETVTLKRHMRRTTFVAVKPGLGTLMPLWLSERGSRVWSSNARNEQAGDEMTGM